MFLLFDVDLSHSLQAGEFCGTAQNITVLKPVRIDISGNLGWKPITLDNRKKKVLGFPDKIPGKYRL